jgi:hypothetical protein
MSRSVCSAGFEPPGRRSGGGGTLVQQVFGSLPAKAQLGFQLQQQVEPLAAQFGSSASSPGFPEALQVRSFFAMHMIGSFAKCRST